MIKTDLNDNIGVDFSEELEILIKEDKNFNEEIEKLYKKYIGFNSRAVEAMDLSQLSFLLNHNRIKDYSKMSILGILLIEHGDRIFSEGDSGFNKTLRGVEILSDIYLNHRESKVCFYKAYLFRALDTLLDKEDILSIELKKQICEIFFSTKNYNRVVKLALNIIKEEKLYKYTALNMFKEILDGDEEDITRNNFTIKEVEEYLNYIENI